MAEAEVFQQDNRAIGLLFFTVFLDLLGFGIILPILPYFATDYLGASELELAWLIAIYSLIQFVFAPIWGKISDRVGRRPIILVGLVGSSISFTIFGLSRSLFMLFLSRGLAGFFTGASLPTSRAYIADNTPPEERAKAFGLIGAAFGIGFTFGPVFGSLLANVSIWGIPNIAFPSFAAALLTLLNFIGAIFWLPESKGHQPFDETSPQQQMLAFGEIRFMIGLPKVGLLILTFASINLVFSGFEAMFPIFAQDVDPSVDERSIGYVFGVIGIVIVVVQAGLIRVVVDWIGEINTIRVGLIFTVFGFAIYPYTQSLVHLILGAIPLAIGVGLSNPSLNSEISKRVPPDMQGAVMGINSGVSSLMRVVGTVIAGFLYYQINYTIHFQFGVVVLAIIFLFNLSKYQPVSMDQQPDELGYS